MVHLDPVRNALPHRVDLRHAEGSVPTPSEERASSQYGEVRAANWKYFKRLKWRNGPKEADRNLAGNANQRARIREESESVHPSLPRPANRCILHRSIR